MSTNQKDAQEERQDEATDARTLDQLEENEKVSSETSKAPVPSPDRTSGSATEDDAGQPM